MRGRCLWTHRDERDDEAAQRRCLAEIEDGDLVAAEEYVEAAVLGRRAQPDLAADEGAAELERTIAEAQPAVRINPTQDRAGAVIDRLEASRESGASWGGSA